MNQTRPGAFTAICVLAIVLGALGALGSLSALVSSLFGQQMQDAVSQFSFGADEAARQMQRQMQEELLRATDRHAAVNRALAGINLLVSGCLFVAAIVCLGLQPAGRRFLRGALAAAMLVDVAGIGPHIAQLRAVNQVTAEFMPRMMQEQQQGQKMPPGFSDTMGAMMRAMGIVQYVISVGMLVIKCVFYGIGISYLGKPETRGLFVPEPESDLDWR